MSTMPGWRPAMLGETPFFACPAYRNFPYCLYVPQTASAETPNRLLVAVHGSNRDPDRLRTLYAPLCERTGTVLLVPLFAIGATTPDDEPGYKFGAFGGVRYDHALLAMIEDAAGRVKLRTERIWLAGYSGGGQFAERFLLLQPHRLHAVSIGAPGYVTLLDTSLPWWAGTGGFAERFGHGPDLDAMRRVAIHLCVGAEDTETEVIRVPEGHPLWVRGAESAGPTRIARLERLAESLRAERMDVTVDIFPGAAHATEPSIPAVTRFLEPRLAASP